MSIAHSGLSGIRAATVDLSTTGNNVANAGTVGFKTSSVEFADIISGQVGGGVSVSAVRQTFEQGSILGTGNDWDLAVSGRGFYKVSESSGQANSVTDSYYTRNGAFTMDSDGYVVNSRGMRLHMFPASGTGNNISFPVSTNTSEILLPQEDSQAQTTSLGEGSFNLDAGQGALTAATVDPGSSTTYHHSVAMVVYDTLGEEHTLNTFFQKVGDGRWDVYTQRADADGNVYPSSEAAPDGQGVTAIKSGELTFDSSGVLQKVVRAKIGQADPGLKVDWTGDANTETVYDTSSDPAVNTSTKLSFNTGYVTPSTIGTDTTNPGWIEMDIDGTSQFAGDFRIIQIGQDGYASGALTSVNIDESGVIQANYTNGNTSEIGKVALFAFNNPGGLSQQGGVLWATTSDSGDPRPGAPGESIYGRIKSQSLESSTVDVTEELVNLITAQRNFQANAKMISAGQEMNQVVLNI